MKTVDIPGGQATVRERPDLTIGQHRSIETASLISLDILAKMPDLPPGTDPRTITFDQLPRLTAEDVNRLNNVQDATIVALLESWTLDAPLPTMDTIQSVPFDVYQALSEATKTEGAAIISGRDLGVSPDPKAPIDVSEPSNTSLSESLLPSPT